MGKQLYREKASPVMDKIKAEMKRKGITQQELADNVLKTGVQHQISDRLNCKLGMTVGEYMAICEYMGVSYDYFM